MINIIQKERRKKEIERERTEEKILQFIFIIMQELESGCGGYSVVSLNVKIH